MTRNTSTVSSKGQITIPQEVRIRLGLREGDRVEFVQEGNRTVLRPARGRTRSFRKYIGAAPHFSSVEEINAWVRELREDDRTPE